MLVAITAVGRKEGSIVISPALPAHSDEDQQFRSDAEED